MYMIILLSYKVETLIIEYFHNEITEYGSKIELSWCNACLVPSSAFYT